MEIFSELCAVITCRYPAMTLDSVKADASAKNKDKGHWDLKNGRETIRYKYVYSKPVYVCLLL